MGNNNEVERGVGLAIPRKEASRGPGSRIARRKRIVRIKMGVENTDLIENEKRAKG